ncbi:hypothetical protein SteCoe_10855 [Stentor coeruleus]|uniref:Uncharacterized protein n=1 Tax=Stentor coeruleus TaxID=5963 RepID=A0A1R2CEI2_9CILI|nr:hypothetical protein SteCoe_10855 [Stentor coeruleus]
MGHCYSHDSAYTIKFIFDLENFTKKYIIKTLPSQLPLSLVFKFLKKNLKTTETNSTIFLKAKGGIYTQDCENIIIGDLQLSPSDKIYVKTRKSDKIGKTLHLKIICCEEKDELKDFPISGTAESLIQAITASKTCCSASSCEIIANDIELSGSDHIFPTKKNILAIFGDNKHLTYKKYWKVKKGGLNLLALCLSPQCQYYKQNLILPKGFGKFNISEEQSEIYSCPYCSSQMQIKSSTLFANCTVTYETPTQNLICKKIGCYTEELRVPCMIEVSRCKEN